MIHFNLPAVEVGLYHLACGASQVGGQQKGRTSIIFSCSAWHLIGNGSDYKQAQRTRACAALPVNVADFFVADLAPLTAMKHPRFLPGDRFVLTNLFGSKLHSAVKATGAAVGTPA